MKLTAMILMYMLWFKFVLGLMFFELVSVLFAIDPHYGNEYTTKKKLNQFEKFCTKTTFKPQHIYCMKTKEWMLSAHLSLCPNALRVSL